MTRNPPKPQIGLARKKARMLLGEGGFESAPVLVGDVLKVAQKDIEIGLTRGDLGDNISGVCLRNGDRYQITFHKYQHENRKRFSIMHELGHIVLDHQLVKMGLDYNSVDPIEVEANQFAAEILMPLSILKKDLKSMRSVEKLAKKYRVSEEAMGWRIYDPYSKLLKYL